jgi:hypothetical protein
MLNSSMFRRPSGGRWRVTALTAIMVSSATILAPHAMAKPQAGKLSGVVHGGVDFPIDGDVHKGATVPIADLGPLNPALAGTPGELRIGKRSQKKVYDEGYSAGVELAYGLSDQSEVFGSVRHSWTGRGRTQVGNAFAPPTSPTPLPINATFGKYKADNIELGYRQYFGSGGLQPYGAIRAGIGFVDKINASFAIPAANIAINNARFYKKSTTYSGGLDLGVSYDVGTNISLQAETGLRYQSKLNDDDTDIAGLGLAGINNTGSRLSVPITLRLRAGF